MTGKKLGMAILSAIMSISLLTGCGGTATEDSANNDDKTKATNGEITVYTALEDEQVSDYLAKFNEKYPDIKVNVVRESTGVITAKLIAEKDNPQADVMFGGDTST